MADLRKLKIVPVRQAFRHEAYDFTYWLEDNIDALAERLGMELVVLEREKAVGSFTVDLFCEDEYGDPVIVENQLQRTDHDHLGKLLTYLVNLDAKTAIWVATEVRQEHQRVIDWLNEMTGAEMSFYFVQVEAVELDVNLYAPLFTVLARPDEQTREIGEDKKEYSERHILRQEFWKGLINKSEHRNKMVAGRAAPRDYWLGLGAGKSGFALNFHIHNHSAGVVLYIDVQDYDLNKTYFDALYAQKEAIEEEFDAPLDWSRLDDKRSSRIGKKYTKYGGLRDKEHWEELQEFLLNVMERFDAVLRDRIRQL